MMQERSNKTYLGANVNDDAIFIPEFVPAHFLTKSANTEKASDFFAVGNEAWFRLFRAFTFVTPREIHDQ